MHKVVAYLSTEAQIINTYDRVNVAMKTFYQTLFADGFDIGMHINIKAIYTGYEIKYWHQAEMNISTNMTGQQDNALYYVHMTQAVIIIYKFLYRSDLVLVEMTACISIGTGHRSKSGVEVTHCIHSNYCNQVFLFGTFMNCFWSL